MDARQASLSIQDRLTFPTGKQPFHENQVAEVPLVSIRVQKGD
jgi:hypothetical protein